MLINRSEISFETVVNDYGTAFDLNDDKQYIQEIDAGTGCID